MVKNLPKDRTGIRVTCDHCTAEDVEISYGCKACDLDWCKKCFDVKFRAKFPEKKEDGSYKVPLRDTTVFNISNVTW